MRHHQRKDPGQTLRLDVPAVGTTVLHIVTLDPRTSGRAQLSRPAAIELRDWLNQWLGYRNAGDTGMRLHEGDTWPVKADLIHFRGGPGYDSPVRDDVATLRRVGWLDQKGRVWTAIPPAADFDGGSLTPLLIDPRE